MTNRSAPLTKKFPRTARAPRPVSVAALAMALLVGQTAGARTHVGTAPSPKTPQHDITRVATSESSVKLSDADRHFRRGVDLYEDGDMSAALVEFSRAYQIVPHYRILYNLGQVAYQRQDYVRALDYFRRYLNDGHQGVTRERRRKVEQDILRTEQRIGRIEISTHSDDDGAEILVDDVRMGNAPLTESVAANVGQRKLELIRSSGQSVVQMVDVVGGETVRSSFAKPPRRLSPDTTTAERVFGRTQASFSPRGPKHAKPPDGLEPRESEATSDSYRDHEPLVVDGVSSSRARSHTPWLGWTAAGLLLGGAAVTGGLALSASRDLQQRREGYPLTPGDLDGPERRARELAMVTDGLLIGALVATAVSLYLTVRTATPAGETTAAQ